MYPNNMYQQYAAMGAAQGHAGMAGMGGMQSASPGMTGQQQGGMASQYATATSMPMANQYANQYSAMAGMMQPAQQQQQQQQQMSAAAYAQPAQMQGVTGQTPGAPGAMAQSNATVAAMQAAMYQQYAMRMAAYQQQQRMMQGAQNPMGMGGPGMGMTPGMGGMGQPYGPMGGGMGQPYGQMGGGMMPMGGGMGGPPGGQPDKTMFFKTRICNKWQQGTCTYGDTCKYAHGDQDLRQAGMGHGGPSMGGGQRMAEPPVDKRVMIELMKKTRLCQEFVSTGACKYGDRCTFAHGEQELRQAPNVREVLQNGVPPAVQQKSAADREALRKTRLCDRFMKTGSCQYGDKCTFAHGQHELRPPSDAAAAPAAGGAGQSAPASGGQQAGAAAGAADATAGTKRPRDDDDGGLQTQLSDGGAPKKQHTEDGAAAEEEHAQEAAVVETDCPLCNKMIKTGRDKMLAAIQALPTPATQKLGAMILGFGTPRFEQQWHKLTFSQLQGMLAKAELSVAERVDLLKTVCFHVHVTEEEREKLDSQGYVSQGLPPEIADFVFMCLDGKEGTAQMTEYFAALEVCKTLYGTTEEQYFGVSSTMANLFMGM